MNEFPAQPRRSERHDRPANGGAMKYTGSTQKCPTAARTTMGLADDWSIDRV